MSTTKHMLGAALFGFPGYFVARKLWPAEEQKLDIAVWGPLEDFSLLVSKVIFAIDGNISREEDEYIQMIETKAPEQSKVKINSALGNEGALNVISRYYKALCDADKDQAEERLKTYVRIDNEVREEEEAFLFQFAQIIEGNEPIRLFIGNPSFDGALQPAPDFFQYISKNRFIKDFPNSDCDFRSGAIYIEHPYMAGALETFSADDFRKAQESMYEGLIPLLQDLGAKRVTISDSSEEKTIDDTSVAAGVNVEAGKGPAKIGGGVQAGLDLHADALMKKNQSLVVTFDGSKPSIIDRILLGRWRKRLLAKHGSNKQYEMIIKGRFGPNKMKTFEYQIKSYDARKIAKALNASAKFDKKVASVGADISAKHGESRITATEKQLRIEFH